MGNTEGPAHVFDAGEIVVAGITGIVHHNRSPIRMRLVFLRRCPLKASDSIVVSPFIHLVDMRLGGEIVVGQPRESHHAMNSVWLVLNLNDDVSSI